MNPQEIVPARSKEQGEEWEPKAPSNFRKLPHALVMDILSRLTVITLFSCRCVCKSWLSLISDPKVTHLHRSRSSFGILMQNIPFFEKSKEAYFAQILECGGSDAFVEEIIFTPQNSIPVSEFGLVNSCNGLLLLSGAKSDDPLYVCNPILGEYITIPPTKGRRWGSFIGLGFSVTTDEYKVLQTFCPVNELCTCSHNYYEAKIYTIGTGVWRSIGNVPRELVVLPFNSFLHGALHWVPFEGYSSEFIYSFNFEREKFQPLPPPSYFGPFEKEYSHCLKLGVLEGSLVLSAFGADTSKFDLWIMKDYGVQESWTKILVIENLNLHLSNSGCELLEPLMFLRNGDILMTVDDRYVAFYDQKRKRFCEAIMSQTEGKFHSVAYSPCFVSLYDVSKGEQVKRVRGGKRSEKLFGEGSSGCAGSRSSPVATTSQQNITLAMDDLCLKMVD
ncbi:F-box protein At3g07870-like [Rosa rugosa]|uniref:F-box protein At3g07870-like n=1 Tax=Rosa rugosa TaxID=74645 RepID=UPI002B40AE0A|nr:F-box protein At3g07870-like [Rosa rugosa]